MLEYFRITQLGHCWGKCRNIFQKHGASGYRIWANYDVTWLCPNGNHGWQEESFPHGLILRSMWALFQIWKILWHITIYPDVEIHRYSRHKVVLLCLSLRYMILVYPMCNIRKQEKQTCKNHRFQFQPYVEKDTDSHGRYLGWRDLPKKNAGRDGWWNVKLLKIRSPPPVVIVLGKLESGLGNWNLITANTSVNTLNISKHVPSQKSQVRICTCFIYA